MLSINGMEYRQGDQTLFPKIDIEVKPGEIKAIQSTVNIRAVLLQMIIGKENVRNGSIQIKQQTLQEDKQKYVSSLGICWYEEGIYERLKVQEYLKFIGSLYQSKTSIKEVLLQIQLEEKAKWKMHQLNRSEKRRVQFGRILMQEAEVVIFEEPEVNVDLETKRVLHQFVELLQKQQKAVLILTTSTESAVTISDTVYRLNEQGIQQMDVETEEKERLTSTETNVKETAEEAVQIKQTFQLNKISAKVEDKIILFDPQEIDYIESQEGQSYLYTRGEGFPTGFTLKELEQRLSHQGFFRCHRSYIVNLQKIREVITWTRNSYSLSLVDKKSSEVPLSKSKLNELKELLGVE
ncbi:transcriptional regulator [Oceanobacillus oncorhynchi subsp. incaldanensis]|uniref:Transcriptional regulatory protein YpdB n=2 Tax=Oceanobacillus TaxID=182709 RepID=A0A0A1MRN4_9BACI|nr:LytTR family transcriptional regulator DNA-binding domain-containing protein [Oceanobacillus oncorhynchi]UUI40892.1 LytTR family transcriptional regulator DNA-binding domain-containing protein [Oceanobacillus oncorhynchi]GIO18759.1 transcriptional regulator [Oceanobacillus oncorhynchi subsp. incaldanensis]CEI82334.1 Transcriptional regulatory protein YpdB [Oceanobacillus oncorhynchi]